MLRPWVLSLLVLSPFSAACGNKGASDAEGGDEEGTDEGTSEDGTESGEGGGDGDGDGDGDGECAEGTCHPLEPNCGEGELCMFFNTEFQCFPDASNGEGTAGTPCEMANECNPGLACIQSVFFANCAGEACCSPHCDLNAPNTCPNADAGETCQPWFPDMDVDDCYDNAGVCGMP